ncbi:MAG: thiolase family protein [Gammaproteobacteria bacterium]|nr:thiolase family protein [Gammaproteobacteria bacterium]
MTTTTYIPYGAYWCSPFVKWQGSLAHLHSMEVAAHFGKQALQSRNLSIEEFDYGVLGMTIPQKSCFYGLPRLTGMMGASQVGGPTISQACATSARVLAAASQEIDSKNANCVLTITTDRISNGPHIYYPNPLGPGGTGETEDWVMSNFNRDPFALCDMTQTAENCASKWKVSKEEQHELVLRRYQQYQQACTQKDGRSFQNRYMLLPLEVPDQRYRKTLHVLEGDEGITESTAEGLAGLRPVKENGTVTYGSQTHPADGSAGMVVTTKDRARDLSADTSIEIEIVSFGLARVELAYMPSAPVPASKQALELAGISIKDVVAIKSHNPFAVNDIIFAKEMGIDVMEMNNYGCSLIWGHPQGPTGMRAIMELIEELVLKGGGYGLFQGCAAGDTAMAVVIKVE